MVFSGKTKTKNKIFRFLKVKGRIKFVYIKIYLCINQIPYDCRVEVTNRFKRLDLIDRVPEALWVEICDTVQEAGIKTIPKKKKCKKAKWLSEEALK